MIIRILPVITGGDRPRRLRRLLAEPDLILLPTANGKTMWAHLTRANVDLVLIARSLLPDPPTQRVRELRDLPEHPEVVVLSPEEDPGDRAALFTAGCMAVLNEHLPDSALSEALRALIARIRERMTQRPALTGSTSRYSLNDFISQSPAMRACAAIARRAAGTSSSLLILGETGVGKERFARAIHAEGPRASGPWEPVNCGALPEGLVESELFGHDQGAFTGATRAHRGVFELAHGGTVFLDEIGELPPATQVKLLRVLEDRSIRPVGSERSITVDVRIIAASNRDLEAEVKQRRFRSDLYYRLAVVMLTIPPLRERVEDIPILVDSYLGHFNRILGRTVIEVTPRAVTALARYPWPGNVRELINVMERAVLLCTGSTIDLSDLPVQIARPGDGSTDDWKSEAAVTGSPGRAIDKSLRQARRDVVEHFERRYVAALLEETDGRVGETARRAGINERSLFDIMKKHGLRKEDFKRPR